MNIVPQERMVQKLFECFALAPIASTKRSDGTLIRFMFDGVTHEMSLWDIDDLGECIIGVGSFRRSICIDYLYYNKDGTMKRVVMTSEGVMPVK